MPPRIGRNTGFAPTFLKEWREHRDLSQDRLVERIRERVHGFSKSSLSRLENGKQPYSQPILEALAWALKCTPKDFFESPNAVENELAAYVMRLDAAKRSRALRLLKAAMEEEQAA